VRKLRYGSKGKGKRGGARVIYYWYNETVPIYALLVYGKNEKTDLTAAEAKVVASFARIIKDRAKDR
jgi:mRNA-degrading endonuclease RelE of RelBE toxin-antitoxin system